MTNKQRFFIWTGLFISFIIGCIISFFTFTHPLTIADYQICEQTAVHIYEQKGNIFTNIPEGLIVKISDDKIYVRKNGNYYGEVKGIIAGGTLELDRDKEYARIIGVNVASGMIAAIVFFIICGIILEKKE